MLLEDYRKERLRKLEEIRAKGIDPYPSKTARNTKIIDVVNHFDEKKGQEVCIAGRIGRNSHAGRAIPSMAGVRRIPRLTALPITFTAMV